MRTKLKHPDIILLEKRIAQLLILEEYEKCVVIRKWIIELTKQHGNRCRKTY